MMVIEKEFLTKWVAEFKKQQNSENRDYYTGYMSAMSTVEGMIAMMPEYDISKMFTADQVVDKVVHHGQGNKRFKLGETILYSPTEVGKILRGELPKEPY